VRLKNSLKFNLPFFSRNAKFLPRRSSRQKRYGLVFDKKGKEYAKFSEKLIFCKILYFYVPHPNL